MNRYNQALHLARDTNGKVTTSQLDITSENQEFSPLPVGDHKASINRRTRMHNRNNIKDSQKKHRLGMVSKKYFTGGLKPVSQRANLTFSSDVDQDTQMFGLHVRPLTINASSPRTYKSIYKKEIKQI